MLIWFNLQRDGTGNGLSNFKITFSESLLLHMSVLHQNMSIFKSGRLSQVHMMPGQNIKKNYNQNVETTCNSKVKFT